MTPTDQGLGATQQAGLGVYLWLIVQLELFPGETLPQVAFQPAAILGDRIHTGREALYVVAPVLFDEVHRRIGVRH